ncbi:putative oligopeptide transporter [Melampsora larici-populina 98AG31]|uniref:Putative oligopeptide transporter n=1 Tax=Melampsora larici-populina (strain 98AG31 / pathotype 3-4-7) TaxID=747676 RepID=F4SAS6_MELLP|nr:putative oligopeptide transporter [Melampsora larici-populina 98AG31]EGF98214.1 putative oligopeptide transporter [Melampsora larici-populina 98AG31]
MDKQSSHVDLPAEDSQSLSASLASDCKTQPRFVAKERATLEALGEDDHDNQAAWKEKAFKVEDVEGVMEYLRQAIEDNDALLHQAAAVLRPGVPAPDIINLAEAICAELELAQENSPYPEVRSCVDPFDDPTIPVLTFRLVLQPSSQGGSLFTMLDFRMWTIGILLVCIGTGVNQFFAQRMPSIGLSVTSAQLVAYPLGCMMARYLPKNVIRIQNHSFTLNPGPFNMKEHMLISIATDIIAVLRIKRFFNNSALAEKIGFQLTLVLSSQLIGYTLAGMTRKFPVYPPAMHLTCCSDCVRNLSVALFVVLRQQEYVSQTCFCPADYILPGVFFQSLSFFKYVISHECTLVFASSDALEVSWTTWIAPHNVKLSLITGTVSGLGLNPVPTLDWSFMALDPIIIPLWSIVGFQVSILVVEIYIKRQLYPQINVYAGACGGFLAISAIYFRNIRFTSYLPINTWGVFDQYGAPYNTSMVLDGSGILDQVSLSSIRRTDTRGNYLTILHFSKISVNKVDSGRVTHENCLRSLLATPCSLHCTAVMLFTQRCITAVSYIFKKLRRTNGERRPKSSIQEDTMYGGVHCRLMQAYPEVPEWWFMLVGVVSIMMAIFLLKYYESAMPTMPIWGLAFSFAIALVLIVPIGIMSAVSSASATLNVLSEFVAGYALVGRDALQK